MSDAAARSDADVAAVVLASRGGARLARALASVTWAGERVVLDPAGRLDGAALPPGVRRTAGEPVRAGGWMLLLHEDEEVSPALAEALGAAIASSVHVAYRIPLEVEAFGATFRLPVAPVRLARRPEARLRLGSMLAPTLAPGAGSHGRVGPPLRARQAPSLAAMMEDLDGDGAALAALLRGRRECARLHHLVLPPLGAAGRVLVARGGLGWPRWGLAVMSGFRVMVAYAKLWELRRAGEAA